ncbi:MAG: hypothetical protein A2543_00860 [Candidatus Komeilibacteria bacterium RIFOXYD2_FULL_37_8]|nr:MAG: hypothetical protein A2543_00860 [Candidatus Komeilibacteria bacterium RIFOXYD2_FULL_37_8]
MYKYRPLNKLVLFLAMKKITLGVFLVALFLVPAIVLARVGVGVGTGKIIIEEGLNPGQSYLLPNFSVSNTGDEVANYASGIEYKQGIKELNPDKEWFSIEPRVFRLEPGDMQNVEVRLNIPIKVTPGDYFAFVEAHPVVDTKTPGANINVAAASKLYFTIKPANIFQGIYYKTVSFFVDNAPWTYIVLGVLILALIVTFFRQKFNFNISIGKKK